MQTLWREVQQLCTLPRSLSMKWGARKVQPHTRRCLVQPTHATESILASKEYAHTRSVFEQSNKVRAHDALSIFTFSCDHEPP